MTRRDFAAVVFGALVAARAPRLAAAPDAGPTILWANQQPFLAVGDIVTFGNMAQRYRVLGAVRFEDIGCAMFSPIDGPLVGECVGLRIDGPLVGECVGLPEIFQRVAFFNHWGEDALNVRLQNRVNKFKPFDSGGRLSSRVWLLD